MLTMGGSFGAPRGEDEDQGRWTGGCLTGGPTDVRHRLSRIAGARRNGVPRETLAGFMKAGGEMR